MTKNRLPKKAARARAKQSGLSYQAVLQAVRHSKETKSEVDEFDALISKVVDASKTGWGFYVPHNCSCESEAIRAIVDETEEKEGVWLDAEDLHQVMEFDFPSGPYGRPNLSPEINFENYFVCAHLVRFATDASDQLRRLDTTYSSIKVTATHLELNGRDEHETTIRVALPEGLYDHLVEISKEEPKPWPVYRLSRKDAEYLDRIEKVLFARGTKNGQHVFIAPNVLTQLLPKVGLVEDRFVRQSNWERLQEGHQGTYHNPAKPKDVREIYSMNTLHNDELFFLPPKDGRTTRDFSRHIKPKFHYSGRAAKFYQPPSWTWKGQLIEMMPSEGTGLPVGVFFVSAITQGFREEVIEVLLTPTSGEGEDQIVKLTDILRYGVEMGTHSFMRGSFKPADLGLKPISLRAEESPVSVFTHVEHWLGYIQKEVLRNPGCQVRLREDPKEGVTYEVTPAKSSETKSFTIRVSSLKDSIANMRRYHPEVSEYLLTERGRRIIGAVLSQGASIREMPLLLAEANKIWSEVEAQA